MQAIALNTQTRVVDAQGRGIGVWRGVRPILGGSSVEDVHVTRFPRTDRIETTSAAAGPSSLRYFLVDRDGKRLTELDGDQALSMRGKTIAGQRMMLDSHPRSYFWDHGYRLEAVSPESAAFLRQHGWKVVEKWRRSYYLVSDTGEIFTPVVATQMRALKAAGMTFLNPKRSSWSIIRPTR
jgi:hypothetical protein